jgi:hypothetical protein
MRRIAGAILAAVGVLVGLALPAAAQQGPVSFSGPVVAGQTLTLACPKGEQVQLDGGAPNAEATFYKAANRKHVIRTDAPISSTQTSVSWLAPRGAKYADATLTCQPTTPTRQTYVFTGVAESGSVTVDCPPERPNLAWVYEVVGDSDGDLSTPQGQILLAYQMTPTGVQFAIATGWAYRVLVECSAASPPTVTLELAQQNTTSTYKNLVFACPPEYPLVRSLDRIVSDLDGDPATTNDQEFVSNTISDGMVTTHPVAPGLWVFVTLTCAA